MRKTMIAGLVSVMTLAACATTPDDPNRKAKQGAASGALLGAVAGAIIGYQGDHSGGALKGALIGGAGGAALGAGVGHYMDKQQAEFERQLADERAVHQVEIERLKNENLKITMSSEVSFDFNSAAIKPAFRSTLDKVSDILERYNRTQINVVGHTDSVGSNAYNQGLSRKRAESVAYYVERRGVQSFRVRTEGRGESEPRASNATEAGRQLNRRVELLIIPNRDIQ